MILAIANYRDWLDALPSLIPIITVMARPKRTEMDLGLANIDSL